VDERQYPIENPIKRESDGEEYEKARNKSADFIFNRRPGNVEKVQSDECYYCHNTG
jgi:hypothetical protein